MPNFALSGRAVRQIIASGLWIIDRGPFGAEDQMLWKNVSELHKGSYIYYELRADQRILKAAE
jgi:hypothetical protein